MPPATDRPPLSRVRFINRARCLQDDAGVEFRFSRKYLTPLRSDVGNSLSPFVDYISQQVNMHVFSSHSTLIQSHSLGFTLFQEDHSEIGFGLHGRKSR